MKSKPVLPLYAQIRQYIVEQIIEGAWQPHQQIPPERELAEQFSVSRITAKNAVLQLVNEGILYRHRGRGTFVSSHSSELTIQRATRVKPTELGKSRKFVKLIGFVIPWVERQYATYLLGGLESFLSQRGYHLVFRRISSPEEERAAVQSLLELPVDGIVIATSRGEYFDDGLVQLVINRFPLVFIEKTMRDLKVNGVFCDTEKAGKLMAGYLIEKAVKEIGLISYPASFSSGVKERRYGFQSELLRGGMAPLSDERILTLPGELLGVAGQMGGIMKVPEAIYDFLDKYPELQAIAVADAWLGRLVGQACYERGLKEMIIVGFDEPSYPPNIVGPAAYIDQSPFRMGQTAAELIIGAIEGGMSEKQVMIEPRLVEL
ncbi:hypothetical protein BK133_20390 [Paenibacillus sp. FSL H8-0548]|uniref:GntR family transcriptional regulator n=1 Tax=Paenibacillus sp. FSL H8-0548 TaxID=1920422 RepID=UPI00096F4290|nr:GntR family transcriptional regulator [Paenibacillus sp. FSL H8-0548]OMF26516.1 hypothetical protein BK133_20390 [Paenibacillus sp. FSL H8-0548]